MAIIGGHSPWREHCKRRRATIAPTAWALVRAGAGVGCNGPLPCATLCARGRAARAACVCVCVCV